LPFYAILRSIPNKLLGVIAMFSALVIIISMTYLDVSKIRGFQFRPLSKICYFMFIAIFIGLMILGAKHVESPYIEYGQFYTIAYFSFFLVFIPIISYYENYILISSLRPKTY
jgi:ubiquinol-cytochrome c reductase cytochrome b subunit